ncbi:MAG: alpha-glucuronidase [Clostridiales Family XIII bacterium]|jgi:alpha-glucuronidase|nr:alpha-glucuronidase [Clostridiales Family XIII bacterium]
MSRDHCWLRQKFNEETVTYQLEQNDAIARTIKYEMNQLFSNTQHVGSDQDAKITFGIVTDEVLGDEGYTLSKTANGYRITAQTTKGLLYGLFGFHREIVAADANCGQTKHAKQGANNADSSASHTSNTDSVNSANTTSRADNTSTKSNTSPPNPQDILSEPITSIPDQSFRMINHWDNIDGSIERGYAGDSIFYKDNTFRRDFGIVRQYASLLASVGINAISINNVNVHRIETGLILEENLPEVKMIADIFSSYGIKTFLSVNFAAPKILGRTVTSDPLDSEVNAFWAEIADGIYRAIPDFGGFVVKADSEGEPGPFTYGRDHVDGANMYARALGKHGGIVIWRCFVYDCAQDWRNKSIDRAKAAYDNFIDLDGKFDENVILQIKLGPIDFQVREPITPLFGGLKKTNQIIEFQLTQEYTGHQKHVYYLPPVWKEVLDFDTATGNEEAAEETDDKTPVKDILKSNSVDQKLSGICAVGIVGMDNNWTGHKLAQANVYAYGRLAWDNNLTEAELADEWIDLSFTVAEDSKAKIAEILLTSRETLEDYSAPLGIGFMVRPNIHYGPDVDGYEYDKWGTYHYADRDGIGRDRTIATGTGYTRQYSEKICSYYDNIETCPDNLLLFFHHVPYTHVLKNGETLIQHIYNTHFEGLERVQGYIDVWKTLEGEVDDDAFQNVTDRLEEQFKSATDWRDQINTYFLRKSGIADNQNREIFA